MKLKTFVVSIVLVIFSGCAMKDPLTSKREGKIRSIEYKKVAGMDATKTQIVYNTSLFGGFAFNEKQKDFDAEVGDFVILDAKARTIRVTKKNGSKKLYYLDENDNIIDIKELN